MNADPDFSGNQDLLPVIAQDAKSGKVLMLAYMNSEAYRQTCHTGLATYYSRSRKRLWTKGEQSGNVQRVVSILIDCDRDTILLRVEQQGPACHEGYPSCFYRQRQGDEWKVVEQRLADPAAMYPNPRS